MSGCGGGSSIVSEVSMGRATAATLSGKERERAIRRAASVMASPQASLTDILSGEMVVTAVVAGDDTGRIGMVAAVGVPRGAAVAGVIVEGAVEGSS